MILMMRIGELTPYCLQPVAICCSTSSHRSNTGTHVIPPSKQRPTSHFLKITNHPAGQLSPTSRVILNRTPRVPEREFYFEKTPEPEPEAAA